MKQIAQNENRSFADVTAAADPANGRGRLKESSRSVTYLDAMRRLDAAVDASAEHTKFAPDPNDCDDAEVAGRGP